MSVLAEFEELWERATEPEKRAIKSYVAGHKFTNHVASKVAYPLPDDFRISPTMRDWAKKTVPHVNISNETQKFRDHWVANANRAIGKKCDWVAAWRNWLRKAGGL